MLEFGEGAARLSGAAALLLGWRPGEFWDATPAELSLALRGPGESSEAPDQGTIEALRLRFPDDEIRHG
jgi:hypothetical protein